MPVETVVKPTATAVWAEVSQFIEARFELDEVDRIELREIIGRFGG